MLYSGRMLERLSKPLHKPPLHIYICICLLARPLFVYMSTDILHIQAINGECFIFKLYAILLHYEKSIHVYDYGLSKSQHSMRKWISTPFLKIYCKKINFTTLPYYYYYIQNNNFVKYYLKK